jgi:O-antigen/teichoic acid export membrane protein
LTVVAVITAIGNLGFSVVVARSAGAATYGALGALLALPTIAGLLATGTQFTVARRATSRHVRPRRLLVEAFGTTAVWMVVPVLIMALAGPISRYLRLDSEVPVVLSGLGCAVVLLSAVPGGLLIGLRRFGLIATAGVGTIALRLVAGAVLARGPNALNGALIASTLPLIAAGVGTLLMALRLPVRSSRRECLPDWGSGCGTEISIAREGSAGGVTAAAVWAIWILPLAFSRHSLTPVVAGQVAAAQVFAGAALFVSGPILTAFYPTVASTRDRQTIVVGFLGTALIATAAAGSVLIFGAPIIGRLYGSAFALSPLVAAALCISAIMVAVGNYAVWVFRALRELLIPVSLGVGVALAFEVIAGTVWHSSASAIAFQPALATTLGGGSTWLIAIGTKHATPRRAATSAQPAASHRELGGTGPTAA